MFTLQNHSLLYALPWDDAWRFTLFPLLQLARSEP
jgi:hypothetical protein